MVRQQDSSLTPILSHDIELRPRGTEPVTTARLLGPRLQRYVQDLDIAAKTFRDMVAGSSDPVAVGAAAKQLGDLASRVLAMAGAQQHRDPNALRSQDDVPGWSTLSVEGRQRVSDALDTLSRELGESWMS
jgi:hypothetical protein